MNKACFWLSLLTLLCSGCGDSESASIHPTPLILSFRFNVDQGSAHYIEKYFTTPIERVLRKTTHVTDTHALAVKNSGTLTVFFEDGIKFSEGEDIILAALKAIKLPKSIDLKEFTELCGDDLSDGHLMHIAKSKGIDVHGVLDRVITVTEDLPSNLMPESQFNAMFENECDPQHEVPLYVLED